MRIKKNNMLHGKKIHIHNFKLGDLLITKKFLLVREYLEKESRDPYDGWINLFLGEILLCVGIFETYETPKSLYQSTSVNILFVYKDKIVEAITQRQLIGVFLKIILNNDR